MTSFFDQDTIKAIRDYFISSGETIATAESVTSGLVQAALSTAPDASAFFQGGITAYNVLQKSRHLQVEPIHAMACNCVSEQVSTEMAQQVCRLFTSDWGVAITGYATPVPESDNRLFAFYSIARNGHVIKTGHIHPEKDEPFNIQRWYTQQLLLQLKSALPIKINP